MICLAQVTTTGRQEYIIYSWPDKIVRQLLLMFHAYIICKFNGFIIWDFINYNYKWMKVFSCFNPQRKTKVKILYILVIHNDEENRIWKIQLCNLSPSYLFVDFSGPNSGTSGSIHRFRTKIKTLWTSESMTPPRPCKHICTYVPPYTCTKTYLHSLINNWHQLYR